MFKIQVPAFADIRKLKLIFTDPTIQKLKTAFRQVVSSLVIVSILGVDIAYAMEDGERGSKSRYVSFNDPERKSPPLETPYRRFTDSGETENVAPVPTRTRYVTLYEPGETANGAPAPTRTRYVSFNDADETEDGKTKEPVLFREGQGRLPASLADSLSSSSEDGETIEEGQGSPTSSLVASSEDGQTSPGTSSPDKSSSSRASSPTGDSSGEEKEERSVLPPGEGSAYLQGLPDYLQSPHYWQGLPDDEREDWARFLGHPPGTQFELKDLRGLLANLRKPSTDPQKEVEEEALSEEKEISPSELNKQMLENFLTWDPSDLDNIEFAEPKKGFWGKTWDCITSPITGAWGYVTSPLEKAWDYVGLGFNESAEKLKETLAKKKRGYSELGEKKEPLLPDEQEGLLQKVHALAKVIKGTSLEDYAVYFKKQIIDTTWRWYQWTMLFPAAVMGGGTGNGMATIILASIFYNEYLTSTAVDYFDVISGLGYYITVSTAFFVFTDSASFLTKAASPSTQRFSAPKSWKETTADWIIAPLAVPQNLFIPFFLWKLEQRAKAISGTDGWWNQFDEYFYFNSLGLLTYYALQPYFRMRGAIRQSMHSDIPSHVEDRVMALDDLAERVEYTLHDNEVTKLYNFLKSPFFPEHTSKFKEWVNYLIRGKISESETVGALCKSVCLTKYAQAKMEKEPQRLQKSRIEKIVPKIITMDSIIHGTLGLFAGYSLTGVSFYDIFVEFTGWKGALGIGLGVGAFTFLVSGFLQSHNFKESLKAIWEEVTPYLTGKVRFKETLKDPWVWVRGFGKGTSYVYALGQNTLTNVAAAFGILVFVIPPYIGGDDKTKLGITIGMGVASSPFFLNETVIGMKELGGALLIVYGNVESLFHTVTGHYFMTIRQERLEVGRIIREMSAATRKFSGEHVKNLDVIEEWPIKAMPRSRKMDN